MFTIIMYLCCKEDFPPISVTYNNATIKLVTFYICNSMGKCLNNIIKSIKLYMEPNSQACLFKKITRIK